MSTSSAPSRIAERASSGSRRESRARAASSRSLIVFRCSATSLMMAVVVLAVMVSLVTDELSGELPQPGALGLVPPGVLRQRGGGHVDVVVAGQLDPRARLGTLRRRVRPVLDPVLGVGVELRALRDPVVAQVPERAAPVAVARVLLVGQQAGREV